MRRPYPYQVNVSMIHEPQNSTEGTEGLERLEPMIDGIFRLATGAALFGEEGRPGP